jgi:glycosidase
MSPVRRRPFLAERHTLTWGYWLSAIALAFLLSGIVSTSQTSGDWNGVTYEVFVRSFADSNGDGKGDLGGLTRKLDYLENLGVNAVWLMPIFPSPSYHKYDVTDFYAVDPEYGTLDDFKRLLAAAHTRHLRVIIDLVLNHTSSTHPWFLKAKESASSPYRNYYLWASDAEIAGFPPAETRGNYGQNPWVRVAGDPQRYFAYFSSGMPDLNYDNPAVRAEAINIGRFWLREIGVDGFRLDAAKHIFPDSRAADSRQWWVEFRAAMKKEKPDAMLIGEVWDRKEVIAPYFLGLDALFDFQAASDILGAVKNGKSGPLVANLVAARALYRSNAAGFRDAVFLSNHDQDRIMSVLKGNVDQAKLAAAIMLTLPGTHFIYYGEELGMSGAKPDEFIREPFVWGASDVGSTTRWMTSRYNTPDALLPADRQIADASSLLNRYRELIRLGQGSAALADGEITESGIVAEQVLSYLRVSGGESLLVLHNLSENPATCTLPADLGSYTQVYYATAGNSAASGAGIALKPLSTLILVNK